MKSLFTKIAAVRGEIDTFDKDKVNKHFKYGYASAAQVFAVVGAAMSKHNLVCIPRIESVTASADNKRYQIEYVFMLGCGDSGESFETRWFGESFIANDDKAITKATTTALKYFLMTMFVVSAGDTPDADESGPDNAAPVNSKKGKPARLKSVDPVTGEIERPKTMRELAWDVFAEQYGKEYKGDYTTFEPHLVAMHSDGKLDGLTTPESIVNALVKEMKDNADFWLPEPS